MCAQAEKGGARQAARSPCTTLGADPAVERRVVASQRGSTASLGVSWKAKPYSQAQGPDHRLEPVTAEAPGGRRAYALLNSKRQTARGPAASSNETSRPAAEQQGLGPTAPSRLESHTHTRRQLGEGEGQAAP